MGITHATVATGTDSGTGEIHKLQWNEAHDVSGFLSNSTPLADASSGNAGTAVDVARSDHVHPLPDALVAAGLIEAWSLFT